MKIPDDIYSRVFELVTSLVNASYASDTRTYWVLYNELREFCEATSKSGRDHPFLWESLADFTDDRHVAIGLYLRSLEQAVGGDAAEYRASIKFALAEKYLELDDLQRARQYANDANEEARTLDDLDLRRGISELLLKLSSV